MLRVQIFGVKNSQGSRAAERFFKEEVATLYHARTAVRLARVRCERGRLDEAAATLCQAREEMAELVDSGILPQLVAEAELQLEQARERAEESTAIVQVPSEAEMAVLRLLATELSVREIAAELFLSPNTVQSHTRAIYRKLGVRSRAAAVARASTLGLLGAICFTQVILAGFS